ncbi:hypothetical protein CYMTET_12399 [Cymbomonas tetramitiformis]|uniref:Uncharacterized protein n=1 Tax=Cymbomonas tetramitiformis TaxID=36881 RepID=A0AAE0LBV7_9CHLO|nr:hypothetical protein CYMTET_12399 [Cymbomonas tetramitiformis]
MSPDYKVTEEVMLAALNTRILCNTNATGAPVNLLNWYCKEHSRGINPDQFCQAHCEDGHTSEPMYCQEGGSWEPNYAQACNATPTTMVPTVFSSYPPTTIAGAYVRSAGEWGVNEVIIVLQGY